MRLFLSAVAAFGAFAIAAVTPASAAPIRAESSGSYLVDGVHTLKEHNRIAAIGVSIDAVENGVLDISATPSEVRQLRGLGFPVTKMAATESFPAADSKYHTYAEMVAELNQVVAAHPSIALKKSIGTSYEGRDLPIIKISDHVGTDEHEPEVLYDAHQHAREHITVEMALYLIHLFTDNYGKDPRITRIVNSRELWIVPDLNPDGGEYDISAGTYRYWRKNRQPNTGITAVGTDLNRNWGYQWGCCASSSDDPSSETYRGPSAFSSTEVRRLRDFVLSRRIGGVQQIKTNIDFHSYSELVVWPYGYTAATTGTGMNADQEATFRTLGGQLARSNGYTAEQSSALYLVDGDSIDWMWATQGIVAYAFEMFPATAIDGGFYPPDEVIPAQTARNREASLQIAEYADCPYRIIGKQARYCGSHGR